MTAAVILACAAAYILWSASRQPRWSGRHRRWLPIMALLAGPGVTLIWWMTDLVFDPPIVMSDWWALLPPMLVIGTFVGVVSSLVFAVVLWLARETPSEAQK